MKANSFYQKVFIVNDENANKTTAMSSIFFTCNNTRTKLQREKKETERTKIYNEMVSVESLLNFRVIGSQYIIY